MVRKNKEILCSQQSLFNYDATIVKEEPADYGHHLFFTVWPILEKLLQVLRKEKEVAEILYISQVQARDRLTPAVDEEKAIKEKGLVFIKPINIESNDPWVQGFFI